MTALILDTSGLEALIAIAKASSLTEILTLPQGKGLSKTFLPALRPLLAIHSFDYIAVCTGPGSYTGTRVGVTVAKTLSFALNIPLIGFSPPFDLPTLFARYEQGDFAPNTALELTYEPKRLF